MQPELTRAFESGALILTATRRLAMWLLREHDAAQRRAGRLAWESPQVLPLGDWLAECWHELVDRGEAGNPPPVLLSGPQEQAVWEDLLSRDPAAAEVLNLRTTASQALAAWELWHHWLTPPLEQETDLTGDGRAWLRWAREFQRRCQERGWLDGARLPVRVAAALGAGQLALPPALVLAGFDRLPPAHEAVIAALRSRGVPVESLAPPAFSGQAMRKAFGDAEEEAWAAARWARQALEEGDQGPLGIVVPELRERRRQIVRCLREALAAPAGVGGRAPQPFNISQGESLADVPLARSALMALRMLRERVPLDVAGHVLRTPFIAGAESERERRGLLEARLREVGEVEPRTATLLSLAAPGAEEAAPRPYRAPMLGQALRAALDAKARQPNRQPAGAWARAFHDVLNAWGWPGERPLDSAEHQAREKWQELLETLTSLERVLPPLDWGDALARLNTLMAETVFQPQTPPAPVQVLGLLESGGLGFSRLWVLGLDDELWPPAARPNPFLPQSVQRRLNMPNASGGQALDYARQHTQRLRQAAPTVLFSHALRRGDQELRASPLIADLPPAPAGSAATSDGASALTRAAERVRAVGGATPWEDYTAPPLTGQARGGTEIFSDMAACPFRAFARHRLRAEGLEEPAPGLGADRRGQLAHRALEFLWRSLGGHAALAALAPAQAQALAAETAQLAIGDCEQRWHRKLSPTLAELERERLAALLLETLALESERAPFRVAAREQSLEVSFGGVAVSTRIDRMDEVAGAGTVLFDYKTGATDVRSWFGDRPDAPQLPIYALGAGGDVCGLAFFAVKRGETAFRGLAESPGVFPGAKEFSGYRESRDAPAFADRREVFDAWRSALEDLGRRFAAGDARVDPKEYPKTCRYCDLPAFCRVAPTLAETEERAEDGVKDNGGESGRGGGHGQT